MPDLSTTPNDQLSTDELREKLAGAEMHRANYSEANTRAASAAYAEKVAPLDATGPLPMVVTTLQFIRQDAQCQYARQQDGSFRLAYVVTDDEATRMEYNDLIAAGKLRSLQPGETPASVLAREKKAVEMTEKVQAILDFNQGVADEKRMKEIEARHEAALQALNEEKEQYLRSRRAR